MHKLYLRVLFFAGKSRSKGVPTHPETIIETGSPFPIQTKDQNFTFHTDREEDKQPKPSIAETTDVPSAFPPISVSPQRLQTNIKVEQSTHQNDTHTRLFPSIKETNAENVMKQYNSVTNIIDHSNRMLRETERNDLRVQQGAVLPPPLFPAMYGSHVFNPVLSRSPSMNPFTAGMFRYPFALYSREFPGRLSAYMNPMPTTGMYITGSHTFGDKFHLPQSVSEDHTCTIKEENTGPQIEDSVE